MNQRHAFLNGLRDGAPFVLVIVPFGAVFGVVGTGAGLDLAAVLGFSVLVVAGASQLAAVQMIADNAPAVIVIVTALAVNLRMAMYSASLTPHLGAAPVWKRALAAYVLVDQSYAVSHARFESAPQAPVAQKYAYFFGTCALIVPLWVAATWAGAVMGDLIPDWMPVEAMVPITFVSLIAPALRTLAHVAAAMTSVVGTLAFSFLPYNTGLLVAAALAMAAGVAVERVRK